MVNRWHRHETVNRCLRRFEKWNRSAVMKIGLFRSCGVGDAVQLTPLFQQIRHDYPQAKVSFFTSANVIPVLEGAPFLDELIGFSTRELSAENRWSDLWQIWNRMRRSGPYNFFLNLEPKWRRAIFLPLVKSVRKAGFLYEGRRPFRLYTHAHVVNDAVDRKGHQSALYLNLWEKASGHRDAGFGYDITHLRKTECELPPMPENFVVMAPGSGNFYVRTNTKRWPVEHWLKLAELFQSQGTSVVWLGSQDDREHFREVSLTNDWIGKLSLQQTIAVIAKSRGVVANDSGLFHVALGLHQKAAGFYGPTDPAHVGPFHTELGLVLKSDLQCMPCWQNDCKVDAPELARYERPYCMRLLTPESVFPIIRTHFS